MKIDKLALQFFDKPEHFGAAMKLLHAQAKAWNDYGNLPDVEEHFYTQIEEGTVDDWLYTKAGKFADQVNGEISRLQSENNFLREALLHSKSTTAISDLEQLKDKILETIHPPIPESENPALTTLFDLWVGESSMQAASLENTYKPVIDLFIRFVNDLNGCDTRISSLDADSIRRYKEFIKNLPKGTKVKNTAISDLVLLSASKTKSNKSAKTINGTCANVGTFLKWVSQEGYSVQSNVLQVLTKPLKISAKDLKQRVPFHDDDLARLFNSNQYIETGKFRTSAMYWAPLIALFSGARMGEILQLERHDIEFTDNLWTINIDDLNHKSKDNYKHVKKDGSRRQVPIHSQLIKLGFIEYVQKQKGRKFPDEERNGAGKFDGFQKRFATYRKQTGVIPHHKNELRDFHSFRHTVRTRLTDIRSTGKTSQQFDEGTIDAIIGHASKDRSEGQKTYNHSQRLKVKNKALNRLNYSSVDFDAIKPWNKCSFWRKQFNRK